MKYHDVMQNPEQFDFTIHSLGTPSIVSPITGRPYISDDECVSFSNNITSMTRLVEQGITLPAFQKAGPREKIYHDPAWSRAAIVTCGGLCPGLNDVIKGVVNVLWYNYGVTNIYGIQYGYSGLDPEQHHPPIDLNPDVVDTIHEKGGTILGSSRGNVPKDIIVDTLLRMKINMIFCIGGDGTLRGAHDIYEEVKKRDEQISVIGIPKTIDNDLSFIDKTFGFETSVYKTFDIIDSAHNEAKGGYNGIGLVKLMGRDSGFIAAYASLANSVVNFCLIPECELVLEGDNGLFQALDRRFDSGKTHVVIVVAEGAGQNLFEGIPERRDASGNILKNDIGVLLKDKLTEYFKKTDRHHSIKYFDPSYSIRSVAAQGTDAIFCYMLAENAVHAAMAGKTDAVVGHWHNSFTHTPIPLATMERQKVDTEGPLWKAVISATRQDSYFNGKKKAK